MDSTEESDQAAVQQFINELKSAGLQEDSFTIEGYQKIVLKNWNVPTLLHVFTAMVAEIDKLREENHQTKKNLDDSFTFETNRKNSQSEHIKSTEKLVKKNEELMEKVNNLETQIRLLKHSKENNGQLRKEIQALKKELEVVSNETTDIRFRRVKFIQNLNVIANEIIKNLKIKFKDNERKETDEFEKFINELLQSKLVEIFKSTK